MGIAPVNSSVTVTTGGTRVAIFATAQLCASVYIEADKSNTANIYVGDKNVTVSIYTTKLSPGQGFTFAADYAARPGLPELNAATIYLDTDTNGNKAHVTYLSRVGNS